MRTLIAAAIVTLGGAACAQEGGEDAARTRIDAPAWIEVSGVAPDDVLNARAEPDAAAPIVGQFEPGQGPLEVVEVRETGDQRWGLVSTGEQGGWINLHYAAALDLPMIGDSPVPQGTHCSGTEPFWFLEMDETSAVWSDFEVEDEALSITEAQSARSRHWPWLFVLGDAGYAILTPEQCSDGMSDIPYAWSALILREGEYERTLFEGCCRLRGDEDN